MIASAALALIQALRYLAEAFMALALILAALITRLIGLLLQGMAYLGGLIAAALPGLLPIVRGAIALACVGAVVLAGVWSWPALFGALGGDFVAAIPATMLCVVPVAYMVSSRHGLGGLLVAAAIVLGIGLIYPSLTPLARGLTIACVMGATVTLQIQHLQGVNHEKQKRAVLGVAVDPAVAVLQRDAECQPDPNDDAR